jgi:hypothetical protein
MINVRGVLGWMRWRVMRFAAMAVLSGFLPALTQPLLALDPTIGSPRQNRVIGIGGHIGRATEAAARQPKRSVANAARPSQNRPAPASSNAPANAARAGDRTLILFLGRTHTFPRPPIRCRSAIHPRRGWGVRESPPASLRRYGPGGEAAEGSRAFDPRRRYVVGHGRRYRVG